MAPSHSRPVPVTNTKNPSRFLALPAELRLQTYDYAFADLDTASRSCKRPGILGACRTTRNEAMRAYFNWTSAAVKEAETQHSMLMDLYVLGQSTAAIVASEARYDLAWLRKQNEYWKMEREGYLVDVWRLSIAGMKSA